MRILSGPSLDVPDVTLPDVLFSTAREHADRDAFLLKDPGRPGAFRTLSWGDVATRVREVGHGLMSLGVSQGDRVAILANTRAEWALADYGTLAVGGITVTVFPTLTAEQILYLIEDSGSKVVFVEDAAQYAKVREIAAKAGRVAHWVLMDPVERPDDEVGKRTLTFDELRDAGRAHADAHPDALDARIDAVKPEDVATIIYTSGTTGVPKGAMITHRNVVASVEASVNVLGLRKHPRGLAFLPLAHSYQRQAGFLLTALAGTVGFSTPQTLVQDLQAVRPTLIACVPRLYERMYDQIHARVADLPPRRQRIFARAEAVALAYGRAVSNGGRPGLKLRLQHTVFDKLVYAKLRESLGFTSLEMAVTGAAAIRPEVLYFFQGIGVNVLEGYGLTETIAPSNVNPPQRFKPGTVGPPYPGMEQAIAEDGEVLMRGPNVFVGYHGQEDETRAAFTEIDGATWYRTGDLGAFGEDGYLRILDRKKEIEVLDTGKNVAPLPIEERLKASPYVMEAMVVATDRKFVGCLIQPDFDRLVAWADAHGVKHDKGKVVVKPDPTGQPMTYAVGRDLVEAPEVIDLYQGEVDRLNAHLADFEQVKAFGVAEHVFTMDRDELTPTLKKKRRVIREHYAELIESVFRS